MPEHVAGIVPGRQRVQPARPRLPRLGHECMEHGRLRWVQPAAGGVATCRGGCMGTDRPGAAPTTLPPPPPCPCSLSPGGPAAAGPRAGGATRARSADGGPAAGSHPGKLRCPQDTARGDTRGQPRGPGADPPCLASSQQPAAALGRRCSVAVPQAHSVDRRAYTMRGRKHAPPPPTPADGQPRVELWAPRSQAFAALRAIPDQCAMEACSTGGSAHDVRVEATSKWAKSEPGRRPPGAGGEDLAGTSGQSRATHVFTYRCGSGCGTGWRVGGL